MAREYKLFDTDESTRALNDEQTRLFRDGRVTNPIHQYVHLGNEELIDGTLEGSTESARRIIAGAVALRGANNNTERYEAASMMTEAGLAEYGEFNEERFRKAISADIHNLLAFKPANLHAEMIRDSVIGSLEVIIETGVVDDTEFISKEVKERASKGVHTLVSKILAEMPAEGTFDAEEIADFFTAALGAIGLAEVGWRVVITEDKKLFTTSSKEKIIYIPKKVKKSADDVKRLAAHEIGVHAQKKVTLDDDVEEGVALLVETVVSQSTNNVSVNRARRRYIHEGLALGAIDGVKRNARQVFQITWKLEAIKLAKKTGVITPEIEEKAKSTTTAHIENIFRGTDYALPGKIYAKAKIYLDGIVEAVKLVPDDGNDEEWLVKYLGINAEGGDV